MLAEERYRQILDILEKEKTVKVSMLIKLFNVSIETVRRDLEYLEKEGHLRRVHGGAVLDRVITKNNDFQIRKTENLEEKSEIAKIAVSFISEGQSIAMNGGTTTLEVAKELKKHFKRLTILTDSLSIADELADMEKYTIIICGGVLKGDEYILSGEIAENNISRFNIDTALIGVSGVSLQEGITDYNVSELQIQKKMIEVSQQVIMLADSNKFDVITLLKICNLDKVNVIITDSKLNPKVLNKYRENGVEVVNDYKGMEEDNI